ncbi:hypothetical protein OPV22_027061 [Ensete ventricosum]|uniref:SHSP domain-containing protein n=1 Tax=Ensete ventricosum TaxID=4639 RepID=A0AAV8PZE8_ENSVE|nr:hypothetical protein OPV22_027061 [Ensete ventricosum]
MSEGTPGGICLLLLEKTTTRTALEVLEWRRPKNLVAEKRTLFSSRHEMPLRPRFSLAQSSRNHFHCSHGVARFPRFRIEPYAKQRLRPHLRRLWHPLDCVPFGSSSLLPFPRPPSALVSEASALLSTLVEWKETPEAHVIINDLPGLKKEEVKVDVEDGRILQINGKKRDEEEDKTGTWHREDVNKPHVNFIEISG